MTTTSISSAILSVLEEREPGATMSVREIVDAVQGQLEGRNRVPGDNEIRGRLSRLHKKGVLERPERGQYALIRAEPEKTDQLTQLADIISKRVRPTALRRTVLWDATPYLTRAEDGGPGTRLVVEHRNAASLQDEVEVAWPAENSIATWSTKTTGPLGPLLWGPDNPTPYRMPVGIVFVEREKSGTTGITPGGYRTPLPERILVEFLGEDGPPETAPIVRNLLQDPDVGFNRLWAAAETLGVTVDVGALLAGLGDELRPQLRADFIATLSPVARTLIKGER
jgi:hypothetical protein